MALMACSLASQRHSLGLTRARFIPVRAMGIRGNYFLHGASKLLTTLLGGAYLEVLRAIISALMRYARLYSGLKSSGLQKKWTHARIVCLQRLPCLVPGS